MSADVVLWDPLIRTSRLSCGVPTLSCSTVAMGVYLCSTHVPVERIPRGIVTGKPFFFSLFFFISTPIPSFPSPHCDHWFGQTFKYFPNLRCINRPLSRYLGKIEGKRNIPPPPSSWEKRLALGRSIVRVQRDPAERRALSNDDTGNSGETFVRRLRSDGGAESASHTRNIFRSYTSPVAPVKRFVCAPLPPLKIQPKLAGKRFPRVQRQ